MPRHKLPAPQIERAALHHENIASDLRAVDEDTARRQEIVARYGDGIPYDRHRVVEQVQFFMAQGAAAMLEAGKLLIQVKEFEPHGDFEQIVEGLGLSPRTARKMMAAAVKFLALKDGNARQKLLAFSPSKLYDLAILDDDDIQELAKGKTVAGITLDEIDAMSCSELRSHLREAKHQIEAKDKVLETKNKKLDQLLEKQSRTPGWRREFDAVVKEISEKGDTLALACAEMAQLAEAIADLQFEGVENESEALALRAQLANRYYDFTEHLLEQSVGLMVGARSQYIEALLTLARKRLPDDIKAKLFGGQS